MAGGSAEVVYVKHRVGAVPGGRWVSSNLLTVSLDESGRQAPTGRRETFAVGPLLFLFVGQYPLLQDSVSPPVKREA